MRVNPIATLAAEGDDSLLIKREVPTLRQQAADKLRQAILNQRFPPGTHLVERDLCELLGVSRTSVREALRHLETEGLIRTIPHKGPVVAKLTVDEAKHIYQVRAALEGLAGEQFVRNATPELVAELQKVTAELREACTHPDLDAILEVKHRFYDVIFEGAANPVCLQMLQTLNARSWLLRRFSINIPGRVGDMMSEVQQIVDAATSGDPLATRDAFVAHVESVASLVLPLLREEHAETKRG